MAGRRAQRRAPRGRRWAWDDLETQWRPPRTGSGARRRAPSSSARGLRARRPMATPGAAPRRSAATTRKASCELGLPRGRRAAHLGRQASIPPSATAPAWPTCSSAGRPCSSTPAASQPRSSATPPARTAGVGARRRQAREQRADRPAPVASVTSRASLRPARPGWRRLSPNQLAAAPARAKTVRSQVRSPHPRRRRSDVNWRRPYAPGLQLRPGEDEMCMRGAQRGRLVSMCSTPSILPKVDQPAMPARRRSPSYIELTALRARGRRVSR